MFESSRLMPEETTVFDRASATEMEYHDDQERNMPTQFELCSDVQDLLSSTSSTTTATRRAAPRYLHPEGLTSDGFVPGIFPRAALPSISAANTRPSTTHTSDAGRRPSERTMPEPQQAPHTRAELANGARGRPGTRDWLGAIFGRSRSELHRDNVLENADVRRALRNQANVETTSGRTSRGGHGICSLYALAANLRRRRSTRDRDREVS